LVVEKSWKSDQSKEKTHSHLKNQLASPAIEYRFLGECTKSAHIRKCNDVLLQVS